MWIRVLGRVGNSNCVVLPQQLLRGLYWERGDFVEISIVGPDKVMLTRFDEKTMPDKVREFLKELPTKIYD